MKSIIATLLAGIICVCIQDSAAATDRTADHNALRALKTKAENAFNSGDLEKLGKCFADEFTFITSDQTVLTNRAEIIKYWNGMFNDKKSPLASVKTVINPEILTEFIGKNTGYCHGISREIYTLKNKRKIAMQSTWSVTLIKEEGNWKIKSAHSGVNFLDNPILKAGEMSWFGKLGVILHLRKLPGEVKE